MRACHIFCHTHIDCLSRFFSCMSTGTCAPSAPPFVLSGACVRHLIRAAKRVVVWPVQCFVHDGAQGS